MKTTHRVVFGDARHMSSIEDKSVQLIVTSPPYWQLKDYGSEDQIGFDDSYEDYVNNLNLVWMECHRVLQDACRLCINIGDQFARSVYYGRYKVIPIRTEIIRFCETIGFDFMGSIIWQKVTTCNTTGGASIMGSYPYPRNGIVKIDYEFILLFKKHGKPAKVSREAKEASKMSNEEWNQFFNGHWNFAGEKQSGHIAMFPEELPRRLIKMFSFVGETVLDPFLGSGTTSLAAMKLKRDSVGYEVNPEFREVIEPKLNTARDMFSSCSLAFENDDRGPARFSAEQLPYLFHDPLKLDKKVDPRKLKFGSVIANGDGVADNKYARVKEVVAPDCIRLDNDLVIRLLGVTPVKAKTSEAIEFLRNLLKGQQVYFKFDANKYDESNRLLAYLYLKNRTFVNAHLVKRGFATVDRSQPVTNKTLLSFIG